MAESKRAKQRIADTRARDVRDRAMKLVADVSRHAERVGAGAEQLGLAPDVVDGVGDDIYEAAVAHLDVASKILERSQAIADRLFDLGEKRLQTRRLIRLDVTPGVPAHLRFVVHNVSPDPATVEVHPEWDLGAALTARIGHPHLHGGRQTSVEIAIPTRRLKPGQIHAGIARVSLLYESKRRINLPRHDFEIWVGRG